MFERCRIPLENETLPAFRIFNELISSVQIVMNLKFFCCIGRPIRLATLTSAEIARRLRDYLIFKINLTFEIAR